MKPKSIILMLLCAIGSWSIADAQVRDIEGKRYKTVKIGDQEWMAENLSVTLFRNGDTIPEAKTKEEWLAAATHGQPAWCYYGNNKKNGKTYGKLYNWYAVTDPRGLAPEGWQVPDKAAWTSMLFHLDSPARAGKLLKSKKLWRDPFKKEHKGNNKSGFNALPAGKRTEEGNFRYIGTDAYFWTRTPASDKAAVFRKLSYISEAAYESNYQKGEGYSVRCIKNE
jgi:uncharacterized protein (TIGR02145 family)